MDRKEVLGAYLGVMQGIKLRAALIHELATDQKGLPPYCVAETLQLQIRKISELLALACLLVHGDVEGARSARLTSAYQADFIMNALEKLHPRFYPRPTRMILRDGKPYKLEDIKYGYLTKPELIKSYREAGTFLHAGYVDEILANKQKVVDGNEIGRWFAKLMLLLNQHVIFLADPGEPGKEPFRFTDGEPAPALQIVVEMAVGPQNIPRARVFQVVGEFRESPEDQGPPK